MGYEQLRDKRLLCEIGELETNSPIFQSFFWHANNIVQQRFVVCEAATNGCEEVYIEHLGQVRYKRRRYCANHNIARQISARRERRNQTVACQGQSLQWQFWCRCDRRLRGHHLRVAPRGNRPWGCRESPCHHAREPNQSRQQISCPKLPSFGHEHG